MNTQSFSGVVQRQYNHVYDTVLRDTGDTRRATLAAESVLKNRFTGGVSPEKNSAHDLFNIKVERFLGNLKE